MRVKRLITKFGGFWRRVSAAIVASLPRPLLQRSLLMPPAQQKNYQLVNAQAAEAAKWMQEELARNKGTLTLEAAWSGVREQFGETFACGDPNDAWLCKPILIAFRKITPNAMWDPAGKRWIDDRSSPTNTARMM